MEAGARRLGHELHDHQLELGELLDRGATTTAIEWPRRAGKTTSVWDWMIGRCDLEPGTNIVVTAQKRQKARERLLDVARVLERTWPEAFGGPKIMKGKGDESFEFANGSRLWIVAPDSGSVRGDAVDVFYLDEPQELDPEVSLDIKQALMPTFDTRPGAQVILSGTPGKVRAGWYWEALQAGLDGRTGVVKGWFAKRIAVSVYAAHPEDDWGDEAVWLRVHPGIGTLTTLDVIRERYEDASSPLAFAMEYLGVWPGQDDGRAINADDWAACRLLDPYGEPMFPDRPARFGIAFDVDPLGALASLVAAWRDDEGFPYWELLEHGDPRLIGREALRVHRKYRAPIGYDDLGQNLEVAEGLTRAKPRPKLVPLKLRDLITAQATAVRHIRGHELRHPDQPALNAGAENAAWRVVGDSGQLFGRRVSTGDITAVVAAPSALLVFDRMPKRGHTRIVTRRAA
jgi:hypothetical protein